MLAINIGKAVVERDLCANHYLPRFRHDMWIGGERGNGAACELWRFRIRQIEVLRRQHDCLGADEAGVE